MRLVKEKRWLMQMVKDLHWLKRWEKGMRWDLKMRMVTEKH